ncbi:hypothetical protein BKA67DRAFT_400034 [Truncatella angustata]|uniref:Uncharacterized protein n=1 Tax=Truncatella angustata TaxID=152316 RepID=A0A9P8RKS4_9PEZI|nr:uncharacterized protein BKA67DRAFT_400034 [Truncatella angustata]KAH6647876.1 hypothetical protein BKA67DRAFT_400034 [Truncatella angustata]
MECPEDQISISSYLISFHKLQIHNALLRCTSNCAPADCQEYRRALDEWFVRWRELVASMPGDGAQHMLLSWGQFNYQHGVFLVSLLGPTPGGKISRLLDGMTTAALQLTRHQQLFGRLYSHNENQKLLMIFPLTWADSHFVLQLALCSLNEEIVTTDEDEEQALALRRYLSLLLRLESDPENLLAGQSLVFEELYKSNRF